MSQWYRATSCQHLVPEPSLTVGLMPRVLALIFLCACLLPPTAALSQEPTLPAKNGVLDPVTVKTDLYPTAANAKKEIDAALKSAATDHKRVLLIFGANWCYDCHVLDRALHDGAAGQVVKESFLLVDVDIGAADKNLDLAKQ